jgi:hypothetical protein
VTELVSARIVSRWWLMPYLTALYWVAYLMDTDLKEEHVQWVLSKGFRLILCD